MRPNFPSEFKSQHSLQSFQLFSLSLQLLTRRSDPIPMWWLFLGCARSKVIIMVLSQTIIIFFCLEPYLLIMEYVMYGKLLTHLREQRMRQSSFFNFSKGELELWITITLVYTILLLRWRGSWRDVDIKGLEQVRLRGGQGDGVPRVQRGHPQVDQDHPHH